jgi:hypothetical protein
MSAWEAMIVAAVAMATSTGRAHPGPIRKKGFSMASGCSISSAPCPK